MILYKSKLRLIVYLSLFLIGISLFSHSAKAAFPFRVGGGLGGWGGTYSESFSGSNASVGLKPAIAGHAFVGFPYKAFYINYSPSLFTGALLNGKSNDPGESTYFAPFAFELGFSGLNSDGLPPMDVFVGAEYGHFKFANGLKSELRGTAVKVGADFLPIHMGKFNNLGLRFEYRKHFVSLDNYGPVSVDSSLSTYYLGIVYVFSSKKEPKTEDLAPATTPTPGQPVPDSL